MAMVISLPLLGLSGAASARAKASGCHKTHSCKSGGGGTTGSGSGADPAPITVQIDPNPLVETGQSFVAATIQVETSPSFAGDSVFITSSQLSAACQTPAFYFGFAYTNEGNGNVDLTLDNDGNATVVVDANGCAPGQSVVEASLTVAPYYTAVATLDALPPVVTTPGLTGYPQTSGTVSGGEVETGDSGFLNGGSYVYGVFYVETDPVYAEQTVEISSPELQDRCGTAWSFTPISFLFTPYTGTTSFGVGSVFTSANTTATTILDDDGNAAFYFAGTSCAAGSSIVTADVEAGSHPTYTTTFNIVAPEPTI
jgi:hypothetical protein